MVYRFYNMVLFHSQTRRHMIRYNILIFTEIDDVVNATLYLLSDNAAMINGIIMPLDGGLTTQL